MLPSYRAWPAAVLSLVLLMAPVAGAAPPADPELRRSRQLVLVVSPAWASAAATAQRYQRQRAGGPWQPVGPAFAVALGKNGLGWRTDHGAPPPPAPGPLKSEGDGRSPAGVLRFAAMRGYDEAAPEGVRWPYQASDAADRCVDDTTAAAYAQLVREPALGPVAWRSAEHLRREDDQYRYLLVTTYNMEQTVPGAGSCIFWHLWREPAAPTAGCTAMAEQYMLVLARWLDPDRAPVAVQLPQEVLTALQRPWRLPSAPARVTIPAHAALLRQPGQGTQEAPARGLAAAPAAADDRAGHPLHPHRPAGRARRHEHPLRDAG